MTIIRALATVAACVLLFAVGGASAGWGLGRLAPGYYREVFSRGDEPNFDPVEVGVGLGLTQGISGGALLGVALVAIGGWLQLRRERGDLLVSPSEPMPVSPVRGLRLVVISASGLLLLSCGGVVGYAYGVVTSNLGLNHQRFLQERETFAPLLAADPAFAGITIREYSAGAAWLYGTVATAEDLDRLKTLIVQQVGQARAERALRHVEVGAVQVND